MYNNQARTLEDIKNAKVIHVHEYPFDMDNVMCVALAKKVNPDIKYKLGRFNVPDDTHDIICDIVGGEFDHHVTSENIKTRKSGKKMASMGCFMQVIGEEIFGKEFKTIDEKVFSILDSTDLGMSKNLLSEYIYKLNLQYSENSSKDILFEKALNECEYIVDILSRQNHIYFQKKETNEIQDIVKDALLKLGIENLNESPDKTYKKLINSKTKYDSFLYQELMDKNSPIRYMFNKMTKEECSEFLSRIIKREIECSKYSNYFKDDINKKIDEANRSGRNYIEVPCQINPDLFIKKNISFIMYEQENNQESNYVINTIPQRERDGNSPAPSKIPFPKEFVGEASMLEKENESLSDIAKAASANDCSKTLKLYERFFKKKFDTAGKDEYTILQGILNIATDTIEENEKYIKKSNEMGIKFVHPGRFFARVEDKESAISLIEQSTKIHKMSLTKSKNISQEGASI